MHLIHIILRRLAVLSVILLCSQAGAATIPQDDLLPGPEFIPTSRSLLLDQFSTDPEAVLAILLHEAEAEPHSAAAAFWLGYFHLKLGNSRMAIRSLRRAQKLGGSPGVEKALGVAYYMERQYVLFRQQMAQALVSDPSDPAPLYYLGRHFDTEYQDLPGLLLRAAAE